MTDTNDWNVNHVGIPNQLVYLHSTIAAFSGGGTNGSFGYQSTNTSTTFGFTGGSSSVDNVNKLNSNYIAYCFHSVVGYQKVGSYTGAVTPKFVQTDFAPRFVLIKRTDSSVANWLIYDSVRGASLQLNSDTPNVEYNWGASPQIQFNSNGFTFTTNNAYMNGIGGQFIYLAIA